MTKRYWFLLAAVLIVASASLFVYMNRSDPDPDGSVSSPPSGGNEVEPIPEGESVTIEGTMLCLPHKDTEGPQTMECAYGLQDDAGVYYGLRDTTSDYSLIMGVPMNVRVKVTGVVEPETSQIYQSTKKIHMTAIEQL